MGVTLSEDSKGDIDDVKGDIAVSRKGDIAMSPESSLTVKEPSVLPTSSKNTASLISWNSEKSCFTNISIQQMEKWRIAFPGIDIDNTLDRIELWFMRKIKSSRTHRAPWVKIADGITNWLQRDFNDMRRPKVFVKQQPQVRPP
jgi:hypothetical protein